MKQINATIIICQLILKQFSNYMENSRSKALNHFHLKAIIEVIIFVWILMLAILTYIFSCSLLISYIKPKPIKLAESIKDILNNSEIDVAGQFSIEQLHSGRLINYQTLQVIMQRARKYEEKMNLGHRMTANPNINFINLDILKDMIKGKAIVLVNSFQKKIMQDVYHKFNLVSAIEKYLQKYIAYYVFKNLKFSAQIANW